MRSAGTAMRVAGRITSVLGRLLLVGVAWLFLLGVVQAISATATADTAVLSWIRPTKNVDGSNLTDLAGYRIHHGTSPTALSNTIELQNPGLTEYTVSGLPPGTHFFALRAVNATGTASDLSSVVSKTIATTPDPEPATRPVYVIKQTRDNVAVVVVGHVPAAAPCLTDRGVVVDNKTYYVVPRELVTWSASVQSEIVVGECN